jgi:hypothetical protein
VYAPAVEVGRLVHLSVRPSLTFCICPPTRAMILDQEQGVFPGDGACDGEGGAGECGDVFGGRGCAEGEAKAFDRE